VAKRRHSSDEEKAACLAAWKACGNVSKAADECGVPRSTLQRWIKELGDVPKPVDPSPARLAAAVEKETQDLLAKLDDVAVKIVEKMGSRIENATLPQLAMAFGIVIDRARLLRGESTVNVNVRPDLSRLTNDELNELDRLAAAARGDRVGALPPLP